MFWTLIETNFLQTVHASETHRFGKANLQLDKKPETFVDSETFEACLNSVSFTSDLLLGHNLTWSGIIVTCEPGIQIIVSLLP